MKWERIPNIPMTMCTRRTPFLNRMSLNWQQPKSGFNIFVPHKLIPFIRTSFVIVRCSRWQCFIFVSLKLVSLIDRSFKRQSRKFDLKTVDDRDFEFSTEARICFGFTSPSIISSIIFAVFSLSDFENTTPGRLEFLKLEYLISQPRNCAFRISAFVKSRYLIRQLINDNSPACRIPMSAIESILQL